MSKFDFSRPLDIKPGRWMAQAAALACVAAVGVAVGFSAAKQEPVRGLGAMPPDLHEAARVMTQQFRDEAGRPGVGGTAFGAQREGTPAAEAAKASAVFVGLMRGNQMFRLPDDGPGSGFVVANSGEAGHPNRVVTSKALVTAAEHGDMSIVLYTSRGTMVGTAKPVATAQHANEGDGLAVLDVAAFQPGGEAAWRAVPALPLAPSMVPGSMSGASGIAGPAVSDGHSGAAVVDADTGQVIGAVSRGLAFYTDSEPFEVGDPVGMQGGNEMVVATRNLRYTSVFSAHTLAPELLRALGPAGQNSLHTAIDPQAARSAEPRSVVIAGFPGGGAVASVASVTPVEPYRTDLTSLFRPGGGR